MKYGNVTVKNGILLLNGLAVYPYEVACHLAKKHGFDNPGSLIEAIRKEPDLTWQEAEFLANANRLGLKGASVIFCLARDIREGQPAQASFDDNLKEFNLSGEGSIKEAVRERIIEFLKDDWKIVVNCNDGGES